MAAIATQPPVPVELKKMDLSRRQRRSRRQRNGYGLGSTSPLRSTQRPDCRVPDLDLVQICPSLVWSTSAQNTGQGAGHGSLHRPVGGQRLGHEQGQERTGPDGHCAPPDVRVRVPSGPRQVFRLLQHVRRHPGQL